MHRSLRPLSAAVFALPMLCATLASPARAEIALGEVSGNWAGASGQGFVFRAVLTDEGGQARLRIWQGMDAASLQGEAQLDVAPVVYRDNIIAGDKQGLELAVGQDASTLKIVTDSDDEQYRFQETVSVQFLDFQYTVVAYDVIVTDFTDPAQSYACSVDLRANSRVVNGVAESLPPRAFEDDNLSAWGPDAALAKGLCPAPG